MSVLGAVVDTLLSIAIIISSVSGYQLAQRVSELERRR